MNEKDFCDNCNQKHSCGSIYHQLGNAKVPSVVASVIVALLLPLVVFITSLAAFEEIFAKNISSQLLQTALSLLSALMATFIYILITRIINKRFGQFI